jgi:hypothetical protein
MILHYYSGGNAADEKCPLPVNEMCSSEKGDKQDLNKEGITQEYSYDLGALGGYHHLHDQ